MSERLPQVLGLKELLASEKSLRAIPGPVVYFSDKEFQRAIKDALPLKRRPTNPPLAAFDPWSGGGFVQSRCESPPGQICFGRWTGAGPGRAAGIYFNCTCRRAPRGPVVKEPALRHCELMLDPSGVFRCTGVCPNNLQRCQTAFWRDPASGRYVLDCRCAV
jgi:hypothetical protein